MATQTMKDRFLQVLEKIDDGAVDKLLKALEDKPADPLSAMAAPAPSSTPPPPAKTREQWLAEAPDEATRTLIASYEQKEKEHRTDLINRLKVASKFDESSLTSMPAATLETLAESLSLNMPSVADFSGRAGAGAGIVLNSQTTSRPLPDTWGLNKKTATG